MDQVKKNFLPFKRAIPLGEILKDRGIIKDEELQEFLSLQRENS